MFHPDIKYINRFFWIWILLTIVVAFFIPQFGLLIKPYLIYLLMGLMFLSCLKIEVSKIIKDFKIFHKVESIFIHLVIIHIVTPLVVLIFRRFLSAESYVGFILAAVTSSAVAIVFLSKLFKGKPRRALELTTISNLLNVVAIPGLVFVFAGQYVEIEFIPLLLLIAKVVFIPLILAEIIQRTKIKEPLDKVSSPISIGLLLIITYGIIAPTRDYILDNLFLSLQLLLFSIVIILIMFFIGFATGGSKKGRITYGLSSSFKNVTLATVIALTIFNEKVALVPIVYTVASNLLLAPAYLIFAKK